MAVISSRATAVDGLVSGRDADLSRSDQAKVAKLVAATDQLWPRARAYGTAAAVSEFRYFRSLLVATQAWNDIPVRSGNRSLIREELVIVDSSISTWVCTVPGANCPTERDVFRYTTEDGDEHVVRT
ncbi:hypothetical protein GCM10010411_74900 [Actinomadura fulvescens]|uniref:Transposase n=1 Tax=Actinomadura fulvescens TaxID=46160 RepID=A0ABP6CRQ4_9ACTN